MTDEAYEQITKEMEQMKKQLKTGGGQTGQGWMMHANDVYKPAEVARRKRNGEM